MTMSGNTIKGTSRKVHITPDGVYLERGYIYLPPDAWQRLYALSKAAGISASQYIHSLFTTEYGTAIKDLNNDETSTIPRNT